jgi:hypothetical protein
MSAGAGMQLGLLATPSAGVGVLAIRHFIQPLIAWVPSTCWAWKARRR